MNIRIGGRTGTNEPPPPEPIEMFGAEPVQLNAVLVLTDAAAVLQCPALKFDARVA